MNFYRAVATGLNKRQLIKYDESYQDSLNQLINKSPLQDYYESIYCYDDSHLEHFKKTKSLSGIKNVKTDRIVFDFDSKSDVEQARLDAIEVANRLIESGVKEEAIQTYWSGNKGFHVILQLADGEMIDRKEFEKYINHFASDLTTFDPKVKDEQRILRVPLTRHNATGLYKVPISVEQLRTSTIEEIKEASNGEYDFSDVKWENTSLKNITIPEEKQKKEPLNIINIEEKSVTDKPDMSRKLKHLTAAKYVLQEGFFEEGERNEAMMILCSTYKYIGYPKKIAYRMLKGTLELRSDRLGLAGYDKNELWNTVVNKVYSPTWVGGTYSESEGLLAKTIKRYNLQAETTNDNLISLENVSNFFEDFAFNIDKNTIKLGIPSLDDQVRITTSMLVSLLAAPGAGKSSISFGFLNNLSNRGEKAVFFSLDMGLPQLFQRLLQRHTGDSDEIIYSHYRNKNTAKIKQYKEVVQKEYKNVKFCFKSGLTCEMIRQYLIDEKENTGTLPRLVVIDYLENVKSPFVDPTQSKAFVASTLKDIANEFQICVLLLVQPTKHSGSPENELTSYMNIKGSGVVAEASSVVMTLYRPGYNPKEPQNDKFSTINIVKNRMGPLSSTDLHWDGPTGNVRMLSSEEENDLEQLRNKVEQRKASEKTDLW